MAPWNWRFPTWKPSFSKCSIGSTWGTASFLVLSRRLRGSLFFIACIEQNDNELLALETVRAPWGDQCHRCVIRIWMFNKNILPPGENEDVAWKIGVWVGRLLLLFFFWNGGLFDGTFVTFRGCRNSHRPFEVSEVHHFVECLDRYFGNVCELDLIFNFHKACEFGMILPLKNPEKPCLVVGAVSICQCREIARHSITISLICTDLYNISVSAWRRKKGPCQIQSNRPWWFVVLPGDSDNSDWSHESKNVVQSVDHPPQ